MAQGYVREIFFSLTLRRGNYDPLQKSCLSSFQVAAPGLSNSLTNDIRSIQNLNVFKNKIKTLPFIDAFIS